MAIEKIKRKDRIRVNGKHAGNFAGLHHGLLFLKIQDSQGPEILVVSGIKKLEVLKGEEWVEVEF